MAARKPQTAARAASPDLSLIPRATDPPPQTASRRALPHTVVWVECTCPGYEGTLIGVCLSFNPAERQAREIALAGQVKRVVEVRAAADAAPARAEAAEVLARAQAELTAAQDGGDAQAVTVATLQLQAAETAFSDAEDAYAAARAYWQSWLEDYPRAMRYVDGWDNWPGPADPPEPMNLDHWADHCPGDLLLWLQMQNHTLHATALSALVPKLLAAKPSLPTTGTPG